MESWKIEDLSCAKNFLFLVLSVTSSTAMQETMPRDQNKKH
jgi:hypothetical protein